MINRKALVLLVFFVAFQSSFTESRKNILRIQKMEPLKAFYDSILKTTNVFYSITVFDGKLTHCTIGNFEFGSNASNDSAFIRLCDSVGLGYSNFQKTIDLMNCTNCFEIGCVGLNTDKYEIVLGYKYGYWSGNRYNYVFPIGDAAKRNAIYNKSYRCVTNNVYSYRYKER